MRLLSILAALAIAAQPFGTDGCPGVQPGAYASDPSNNVYTIGFLFKGVKGKDKATYFATEGDLVIPAPGTKVWTGSSGPAMRDLNGKTIGHFIYAFRVDTPAADTFGLVRLDKNVKFKPGVCHFGGPTDVYSSLDATPFQVQFYGQGLPFVSVVPARSGVALGGSNASQLAVLGPAGLFAPLGDGGGPVLAGGKAIGIFTGGLALGTSDGFVVSRLKPALARTEMKTGIKLTLLTSPAL